MHQDHKAFSARERGIQHCECLSRIYAAASDARSVDFQKNELPGMMKTISANLGDRDYNDLVFAVEIGTKNVQALANPEPHQILTFLLLGATVYIVRRRLQGKRI